MRGSASIVGALALILFGPIVWAAQFLVVYAGHASLCEAGDRLPVGSAAIPWLLGIATAAALVVIGAGAAWPGPLRQHLVPAASPGEGAFLVRLMRLLALLALFGVGWSGIAMLVLPSCLQLR
jgi:hypothetical protein